jgi:hypothetical protein
MGASRVQDASPRRESLQSVLSYKRLDRGTFQVPKVTSRTARHVEVDDVTLEALLDGIDVEETAPAARPRRTH